MASDAVLDRLEAAFSKRRTELLASDAGRWALFVQPANRHRRPELVGCYDTESEACETVALDQGDMHCFRPMGRHWYRSTIKWYSLGLPLGGQHAQCSESQVPQFYSLA